MTAEHWTPTQRRMLALLSDGMPHSRHELHACLEDNLGAITNIRDHISKLRGKLRPRGETIVCEVWNRTIHYRWVRLLDAAIERDCYRGAGTGNG